MVIYLDNPATSYPKPPQVARAMAEYMLQVGAPINRSAYGPAQEAAQVTLRLRERLARFLGFPYKPSHVILTPGCTAAINQILFGYLRPGDHCLVSAMEHNAVMRPLTYLAQTRGVTFDRIPCDETGLLDPFAIGKLVKPNTRLAVIAHGSNVSGVIQDAEAIGAILADYGVPFALDAAQTAGETPVDFDRFQLSALAVPGHKSLMGPAGTGALLVSPDFARELQPIVLGGTGSEAHSEIQPAFLPDRFEPGTPNLPGFYGLDSALSYLEAIGIEAIRAHDQLLCRHFVHEVSFLRGVRLVGPTNLNQRLGVFSLDFIGRDNDEMGQRLERQFGILTRCGLHCAPNAHKTLGTYPQGTVRMSTSYFTTIEELDAALEAIDILSTLK